MSHEKDNYNIDLSNKRHLEQIEELIEMYNSGIVDTVFDKFIDHINNFKSNNDPERSKTLEEWEAFYVNLSSKEIEITQNQLELLFQYMRKSKGTDIKILNGKFHTTLERSTIKKGFKLEYLVLKTLEMWEKQIIKEEN